MGFDAALAQKTVELSRIAYQPAAQIQSAIGALGLSGYQGFSGPSTQAFVSRSDTHGFLTFRGTESTNHVDWLRDAEFRPVTDVFGTMVHSGFRRALDEVWTDILPHVAADNRALIVTGHSLGAGLAVLAAGRLASTSAPVDGVYTYGSPRTGLKDFAKAYRAMLGASTFRFINHIDIVTRVPLLLQNYRHVGRRMYFDGAGRFHPDAGAWHIARDDMLARLRHFGTIRVAGIGPHEISRYVDRIGSL